MSDMGRKKSLWKKAGVILAFLMMTENILSGGERMAEAAEAGNEEYADTSAYERLDDLYQDYFKFGVACEAIDHWNDFGKEIGNPAKEKLISTVFNSITCGNEMKPAYNFDPESENLFAVDPAAEEMMDFAVENDLKMRGHVLIWHSQVDPSIFAVDYKALSDGKQTFSDSAALDEECLVDRETLLARMKSYIYGMMEYTYKNGYAETIYAWDVVNEAADESNEDGLRRSYWYRIIGPDYLYYAFLYAREAETLYAKQYADLYGLDAEKDDLSVIMPKLFYNDYNEWFALRSDKIVEFLTKEKWNENHEKVNSDVIAPDGDGTIYGDGLLDGIGMQGHLNDTQNIDEYMTALEKYSAVVDEVHITELDVGCSKTDENVWYYQAKFYYDFFSRLIEEVEKGAKLTSVTVWGLTDDASWRVDANPLLFYGDLEKKPAFDAIVLAAKGEEFTMTLADTLQEVKDLFITFEPYQEGGKTKTVVPKEVGIFGRGTGHQASLSLAAKINHTQDAAIGYSLLVTRKEQDASMKLDLSRYAGKSVTITAYVMTEDKKIIMGMETDSAEVLTEKEAEEEWTLLSADVTIPEGTAAAFLYIETDGSADFYVDDISVVCREEGETQTKETGNEEEKSEETKTEESLSDPSEESEKEPAAEKRNVAVWVTGGLVFAAGVIGFLLVNRKKNGK